MLAAAAMTCGVAGSRPRGQRRPRCPDRPNHLCSLPCRRPRTVCCAEQPSAPVFRDRKHTRDDEHRAQRSSDDLASIDAKHHLGARRTARRDCLYSELEVMVPMKPTHTPLAPALIFSVLVVNSAIAADAANGERLARISHTNRRIGAANQRKLLCRNDLTRIRGEPRCRQSVARNRLILEPWKVAV